MAKKPLKMFKVNNISEVRDVDALYCIKTATDTEFSIVVTDAFGAIVNLKDLQTPAGIQGIASDDGTIEVTGTTFKNLRLSTTLVDAINSALKPGDNISELVNDAGYLTSFTEIDPIFQASEASNFVSGDKANLDNQSGINTGDETVTSIQTKRPLKTVDGKNLEGTGNIEIDYNTVINKPTEFPPSAHTHIISEVVNLQNELNSKENISNKVNTISGNSSTEYPTEKAVVEYVSSQIGADFAKVVYFDNVTPNVASIFDLNNPPLVNDLSLKEDVANLYIGTDASTWVYITSPAGYITKTVTSSGSNFYITDTNTDAGSIKTGSITKKGQFVVDSELLNDSGLTLKKTISSVLKTDSLGKVIKTTNLQDVKYALETHATTHEATGSDPIAGENLSVNVLQPTSNYIPLSSTLKGHLQGIDSALGDVDTDSVLNRSTVIGTTTTNALDSLNSLKEDKANKNIANGYVGLDSSGKINPLQLPALAITDTFVVNSQTQMLALVAEVGDVAVRTDLNKSFILRVTGASTLANWQELLTPVSVDQTIIDGSTNAVSGNAVFDGLATKFPTPTGLTTKYLPKWNGSGFGNSKISDNNVGISFGGSTFFGGYEFLIPAFGNNTIYIGTPDGTQNPRVYISHQTVSNQPQKVVLGSAFSAGQATASWYLENGRFVVGSLDDNGEDKLQVNGTITASPAVSPNQVVVKSQLDAVAGRPYKVYTALLSQTGTNAPTAIVLENTIGSIVWTRLNIGDYRATLTGVFVIDKTFISATPTTNAFYLSVGSNGSNDYVNVRTYTQAGASQDNYLQKTHVEIRVYN